jgi:hypothetical protein
MPARAIDKCDIHRITNEISVVNFIVSINGIVQRAILNEENAIRI